MMLSCPNVLSATKSTVHSNIYLEHRSAANARTMVLNQCMARIHSIILYCAVNKKSKSNVRIAFDVILTE